MITKNVIHLRKHKEFSIQIVFLFIKSYLWRKPSPTSNVFKPGLLNSGNETINYSRRENMTYFDKEEQSLLSLSSAIFSIALVIENKFCSSLSFKLLNIFYQCKKLLIIFIVW